MHLNLDQLNEFICENIEEVIQKFEIELRHNGNFYVGACPIHGGDNKTAFNIFVDGHTKIGNWICHTHHCENHFVNNTIGFLRGIFSHRKNNWSKAGDKVFSFKETLDIIKEAFNISQLNKSIPKRLDVLSNNILLKKKKVESKFSRRVVRQKLKIPSAYFLNRGYSAEILDKYDIGDSSVDSGLFANRAVVPIYEESGKEIVGFTGRTTLPKCDKCKSYHLSKYECNPEIQISKWCNSKGFSRKDYLYNYNFAKSYIRDSGVAILVEGAADVWRLEEAGIHNSIAIFGSSMTDAQQIMLESSGALCLVLLFDTDSAGMKAKEKVESLLNRLFNIINPIFPEGYKDIGEMNIEEVKQFLVPVLEKVVCKR